MLNQDAHDKLFLTEVLNDLHKNGFRRDGKAAIMLRDWSRELKLKANYPVSQQRRVFNQNIGKDLYYDA